MVEFPTAWKFRPPFPPQLATCFVSSQSVWKDVPSNLVTSYTSPATCYFSLICLVAIRSPVTWLLFCFVSARLEGRSLQSSHFIRVTCNLLFLTYLSRRSPFSCYLALILFRLNPSGRRYLDNRVCWNGPRHSNVPGYRHEQCAFGKRYEPTLL